MFNWGKSLIKSDWRSYGISILKVLVLRKDKQRLKKELEYCLGYFLFWIGGSDFQAVIFWHGNWLKYFPDHYFGTFIFLLQEKVGEKEGLNNF